MPGTSASGLGLMIWIRFARIRCSLHEPYYHGIGAVALRSLPTNSALSKPFLQVYVRNSAPTTQIKRFCALTRSLLRGITVKHLKSTIKLIGANGWARADDREQRRISYEHNKAVKPVYSSILLVGLVRKSVGTIAPSERPEGRI